jgi:hypothetical protein
VILFVLLAVLHSPEECLGKGYSAEHQGKTYSFAYEDCRVEFLTDPERYSQLYDALRAMQAAGVKVEPPKASLVPS